MTGRGRTGIRNVPFSGSGTYPSPDRAFGSERSERTLGIYSRVLFGFFVSYLDFLCPIWIFSVVFLDFLCPIWIFCVLFGDFQSFYGDFVAFSWKTKIPALLTQLLEREVHLHP